jgi:hypothetical protein
VNRLSAKGFKADQAGAETREHGHTCVGVTDENHRAIAAASSGPDASPSCVSSVQEHLLEPHMQAHPNAIMTSLGAYGRSDHEHMLSSAFLQVSTSASA